MNITEAYEAVYMAAVAYLAKQKRNSKSAQREQANLERALKKISPRIQRMRSRLDFSRARRAGKQSRPSWATP